MVDEVSNINNSSDSLWIKELYVFSAFITLIWGGISKNSWIMCGVVWEFTEFRNVQ